MGLRCLLGHDYGDPELERDRDEQGEEVVVTIREVATCTRCGKERVVSENKEVTSIASPAEIEGLAEDDAHDAEVVDADGVTMGTDESASDGTPAATADAGTAETATGADTPETADTPEAADADAEGGAEIIEETTDEPQTPTADEVETPTAAAEAGGDADDGPSAEEDDGVILDADDDDDAAGERGHGEWPEADDVSDGEPDRTPTIEEVRGESAAETNEEAVESEAGAEPQDAEVVSETEADRTQWPEQVGDDEGFDAEPGDGSATDVEFGGIAPESDAAEDVQEVEEGFDAEFVDNGSDASRAANGAITRATEIDTSRDSEDVPTEYVCPECGLRRPATGSSMREGDICPECKRGYIAEEPR